MSRYNFRERGPITISSSIRFILAKERQSRRESFPSFSYVHPPLPSLKYWYPDMLSCHHMSIYLLDIPRRHEPHKSLIPHEKFCHFQKGIFFGWDGTRRRRRWFRSER
jgi:hypothetical protein